MEKEPSLTIGLDKAREFEKNYDWLGAAELYKRAAGEAEAQDAFSKAAELLERVAYSLFRAAHQADSREQFEDRVRSAEEAWERASNLHSKIDSPVKAGQGNHCRAQSLYVRQKRLSDTDARRKTLDDCRALERSTVQAFEDHQYSLKMSEACIGLLNCLVDRLEIEWDGPSRERMIAEALDYGEKAIRILSGTSDISNLVRAHYLTAFFCKHGSTVRSYDNLTAKECGDKSVSYADRAIELARQLDDVLLIGRANFQRADSYLDVVGSPIKPAEKYVIQALEAGRKCGDHLLMGDALYQMTFITGWDMAAEEDPDRMRELAQLSDKYSEEAILQHSLVAYDAGISWAVAFKFSGLVLDRLVDLMPDFKKKKEFLLNSLQEVEMGLVHAGRYGSFEASWWIRGRSRATKYQLAKLESDKDRRKALFNKVIESAREDVSILEGASGAARLGPILHNLGTNLAGLGWRLGELSAVEDVTEKRLHILKEATAKIAKGIDHIEQADRLLPEFPKEEHALLGRFYRVLATRLANLFSLTGETNSVIEGTVALRNSVHHYDKAGTLSFKAESLWLLASTLDRSGNYVDAVHTFELAAQAYEAASKVIPSLAQLYQELASYMRAWSQVAEGRQNHSREQYGTARDHYGNAARILEGTKAWSYLAPNFSGWAALEGAEENSRFESYRESIEAFKLAAALFEQAKVKLDSQEGKLQNEDEKKMVVELSAASVLRREYSLARIGLEEGRLLQMKGDQTGAMEKYRSSHENFEKIVRGLKSEQDRKEMEPILHLCDALYTMTRAESKGSPDLYGQAAKLFEKVKEYSTRERIDLLADGGMQFCKALEAASWFRINRNPDMLSRAKLHLQSAAESYSKAGFERAAGWARATERLLDAYVYTDAASKEVDPEKKAKYYGLSEKLLQLAAEAYGQSGYEGKKAEVLKSLKSLQEEREIALTLSDILKAPPSISTTATFTLPAPTYEASVGLERFEHADVQANISTGAREIGVGDKVDLQLELVNAGKAPALLMKIEKIVPEGFELSEKPETYRMEEKTLELKGRRLDPLKTAELKLALKALSKGVFTMKPRILYLDDTGKYRAHEPEPITVTVKELGISGWIRGPAK